MQSLVLTVIGPDKPGVVDSISKTIADHGGSWEESRMSRLAGQFAGILRVAVADDRRASLFEALMSLEREGLRVVVQPGEAEGGPDGGRAVRLDVMGADRSGIVQRISHALAERGVNVDTLDTEVLRAPMSSELLFQARARLRVPDSLGLEDLRMALEGIAGDLMVDVDLHEDEEE